MPDDLKVVDITDLAKKLNAIAQTGLTYARDVFDRERYEALQQMAVELIGSRFDLDAKTWNHVSEIVLLSSAKVKF